MTAQKPVPVMVAIDPGALDALRAEIATLTAEIRSVKIAAQPEWMDAGAYARLRGVSRRTVMNWIARGEIESRRTGSKTQVRVTGGA